MPDTLKPYCMIIDYVTGKAIPNVGAEENRQMVERFLVNEKGYSKADIEVDVDLEMPAKRTVLKSTLWSALTMDTDPRVLWRLNARPPPWAPGKEKYWPPPGFLQKTSFPFQSYPMARQPLFWIRFPAKGWGKG
jgi:hypothetical protein